MGNAVDLGVTEDIPSRQLVHRALRLVAMAAAAWGLEGVLGNYELASLLLGVFAIELLMGKVAFGGDGMWRAGVVREAGKVGLGFGAAVVWLGVVIGICAWFGWVRVRVGEPSLMGLGMGLVVAFARAGRDEMLLRGAPLGLMKGVVHDRYAVVFVALLSSCSMLLDGTLVGVLMGFVSGWIFALCWRMGAGIGVALGAHGGWLFFVGPGMRGGILDVSLGVGQLLPVKDANGGGAWVALFVMVMIAVVVTAVVGKKRVPSKA